MPGNKSSANDPAQRFRILALEAAEGAREGVLALISGESWGSERSWASFAWRFGGISGRDFAGRTRGFICGERERRRHGGHIGW